MKPIPEYQSVTENLFVWNGFNPECKTDCSSTAVRTPEGFVLIDPIRLEEQALTRMVGADKVVAVLLTNGNHERGADYEKERLDGLVNNAVARPMSSPGESTREWEESLRVNATGIYLMHRHFGPLLRESETSSIVNIGSIYGMVGPTLQLYEGTDMGSGCPDYYFNKAGMVNLTRFYAAQLGADNVRVNCLSPGGFFNNQPEPFLSRYNDQTFLKRMGNESDLGGSVVFLLSDASRYITGVNLPVDGGFTAH